MVYLYAALGVAMMTGIMAITEMGMSLTGQSLISKPLNSEKDVAMNTLKGFDEAMLGILYERHKEQGVNGEMLDPLGSPIEPIGVEPLKSSALCQQVLCRINRTQSCLGEKFGVNEPLPSPVSVLKDFEEPGKFDSERLPSGSWSNSCALNLKINGRDKYRFLIFPDTDVDEKFPYHAFSCALKYNGISPEGHGAPTKCDVESGLLD